MDRIVEVMSELKIMVLRQEGEGLNLTDMTGKVSHNLQL